jgi:hypothetical protein
MGVHENIPEIRKLGKSPVGNLRLAQVVTFDLGRDEKAQHIFRKAV